MLMYILCEEVRPEEQAQTAFLCERPQDPTEYRNEKDVQEHQCSSMWRTQEWRSFQQAYGAKLIFFDQGPFGHPKRKPTRLALINLDEMIQLQNVRSRTETESTPPLSMSERCARSKTWAAPCLKAAVTKLKRSADGFAVKRLHECSQKIWPVWVMSLFNNGSSTTCRIICRLVETAAIAYDPKAEAVHTDECNTLNLLL